jgi:hypothetical protein
MKHQCLPTWLPDMAESSPSRMHFEMASNNLITRSLYEFEIRITVKTFHENSDLNIHRSEKDTSFAAG